MSASNDNEGKKEEREKCVLRMKIVTSRGQKKKKGSKTNKVYTFYAIQGVRVNITTKPFSLSLSLSQRNPFESKGESVQEMTSKQGLET